MGTGYTRADVANNIADGNIVNASDLDNEYDAIEAAFNSSTGHTHDGTAAEGGAITVVGPVQDLVVSATEVKPKTTNTLDLGTSALLYKDAYLQGNMYFRDTALKIVSSADGQLDIDADVELELVAPTVDIDASTAVTIDTATLTVTGSANVVGDLDVDNININGNTISSTDTNGNITLAPNGTGVVALSSTDMTFGDNDKAIFGAGSDLKIYHTSNHSYIDESGTGNLYLSSNGSGTIIVGDGGTQAQFFTGGAVNLFHNSALKLATTATGVDVTGTVTADGLTVDGDLAVSAANSRMRLYETDTTDLNTQLQNQAGDFNIQTLNDSASLATNRISIDHATGDISFYEDTGTTAKLFWDASAERLGIGTTSPDSGVHVESSSGSNAQIKIQTGDTTSVSQLIFGDSADSNTGGIQYAHSDDSLQFHVANVGEKMRIDSSGNVGIGASDPNSVLTLEDTGGPIITFKTGTNTASSVQGLKFYDREGTGDFPSDPGQNGAYILCERDGSSAAYELTFGTINTTGVNATERMRISKGGNVGINTDNPIGVLDARASATSRVHINSSGDLIVASSNGGDVLQLIDSAATSGTDANPYMEFLYASSLGGSTTRLGYLGYGSGSDADMYLFSNAPNSSIRFYANNNLALRLHPDGEVTTTDQPSFRVVKNADQTLTVGTSNLVTWETEIFDVGSNFATNRFTAPVTGKYFLHVVTRVDAIDTAATYYRVSVTTSNRSVYYFFDPNYTADTSYQSLQISGVFDMDAGDTAFVYVTQLSGTASHVDATSTYTAFSGYLLG